MGAAEITLDLACDEDAPRRARESIDDLPVSIGLREDARLLTSELVTNALLHSGCSRGDLIAVRVSLTRAGSIVIAVCDPGHSEKEARIAPPDDGLNGGVGLRLVDLLAHRWGSERSDGHVVWAELAA